MSEQEDELYEIIFDVQYGSISAREAKESLEKLIKERERTAEERMGDAVIERMRQTNFQWEKVDSFIHAYQDQKTENVYNLKALQKGEV